MATGQGTAWGDEGPLAHAARVASEQSYLDGLVDTRRSAWERASGARPQRTPKRLLVSLSHSIEKAVLGGPIEYPTVVVALFQQLRFFDREREVYARMAAAGVIVVVGFVEGEGHRGPAAGGAGGVGMTQPPEGVHVVSLRPDEPLADEWSVVAVGPKAGAFLVATDQHAFDPTERAHEASREFVGRWGYSRAQAGTELARLRFSLGDRLDVVLRGTIDDLLAEYMPAGGAPAASAGTPGETWATTSLGHMMDGMLTARAGTRELREQLADAQRAATARAAATTDPQSGVANPDFLQRWSHPTGANPLPIGLALFDVAELDGDAVRGDERASYFAAHQVAAALSQPLGPVDAVVRMSAREFLVVVPGASERHLAGLADRISEQLELASHGYPDIALRARVATVVTCRRPLPVDELHGSLTSLDLDGGSGPLDAGEIDGGRITVSSTALHAVRPGRSATDVPASDGPDSDGPDSDGPSSGRPEYGRADRGSGGPDSDGPDLGDPDPASHDLHPDAITSAGPSSARTAVGGAATGDTTNGGAGTAGPSEHRSDPNGHASSGPDIVDAPGPAARTAPADRPVSVDRPAPTDRTARADRPASADRTVEGAVPAPPQPRPAVSPFGHTASQGSVPAAQDADRPSSRHGGHRAEPDGAGAGGDPVPDLPQRTAQEALHRLVYGDDPVPTGDPRARMDVFADLSDPPNGHRR